MLVLTRRFANRDSPGEEIWIDGGRIRVVAECVFHEKAGLLINDEFESLEVGTYYEIEPGISVYCARVTPHDVRLGITAPEEMVIDREEIHHMKHSTTWRPKSEQPRQGGERGAGSGASDCQGVSSGGSTRATV